MKNLYDVLGIQPTASASDIRSAYLAKAKESHPDAGGSGDAFSEVRLAYDVLCDEQRRRNYDATGQVADIKEAVRAGARAIIENLLELILQKEDASYCDVIDAMKTEASSVLAAKKISVTNHELRQAKIIDFKERFRSSSPDDAIIHDLLDKKVKSIQTSAESERTSILQLLEVLRVLDGYNFDKKAPIDLSAFGPPIDDLLDTSKASKAKDRQ